MATAQWETDAKGYVIERCHIHGVTRVCYGCGTCIDGKGRDLNADGSVGGVACEAGGRHRARKADDALPQGML